MRSFHVWALGVVAGLVGTPLAAQIPPGGGISVRPSVPLPKVMVSNPYVLRTADSAVSVQIGAAIRIRMERVTNGVYNIMTRDQMNTALVEYTYPRDAILSPSVQRQFASAVNARVLLGSSMARTTAGKVTVTARIAGLNDDAGSVVVASQGEGQAFDAFGSAIADQFGAAVKAAKDAKACMDQRTSDAKKAEQAARRALVTNPKDGLAYLCLAQLAADRKAPSDSLIGLLTRATESDPLSLPAWALLAQQHLAKADTAKVVTDYQAMLLAAPTNEPLRKEAFQFFLQAGRTDAARKAVEEALAMDEYNPDLYDLLSNVCVFENNYHCAVDALEKLYAIDSTKADSSYYTKITVFASQPPEAPDTTRLIKWATAGIRKYPSNVTLVTQLLGAYALQGNVDSMISVAKRLLVLDTSSVTPALMVANELAKQDSVQKALTLIDVIAQRGTADDKEKSAIILVNAAFKRLQAPPVDSGLRDTVRLAFAADLGRRAVKMIDSTSRIWANANYAVGLSTVLQISKLDPESERQKSCDLARREDGLVDESTVGLTRGRSVNPAQVDQYVGYLNNLKKRTQSMIRAYCK